MHIHPNMRFDILPGEFKSYVLPIKKNILPGELLNDPVRYWILVKLLYLTVF